MINKIPSKLTIKNKEKEMFKIPKFVKVFLKKDIFINSLKSIISQLFPFLLTTTTMVFSTNKTLAIVFLIIYLLREPIIRTITVVNLENQEFLDLKETEYITNISGKILAYTRNKVIFERDGRKQKMSATVIMETLENYIKSKNKVKIRALLSVIDFIVFVFSLVALIKVAISKIDNITMFSIVLIITAILLVINSILFTKAKNSFYRISKPISDAAENAKRDSREIEASSAKHLSFLLNRVVKTQENVIELGKNERKKKNLERVVVTIINSVATIVVALIIIYGANEITATLFMNAIAFSQVFSSVIGMISEQVYSWFDIADSFIEYKSKYQEDYNLIINEYFKNVEVTEIPFEDDVLNIKPFRYQHDITEFNLALNKNCSLKKGELVLLNGRSGAGKSTFVKIISGELRLKDENPWRLKSIKYFNDTSVLGTENLLKEIALETEDEKIDVNKLMEIIKGIELSSKFKNPDDLRMVSAKELSNGLLQRVLLARTLYNLEDNDLVCIDEPIGSLDEETANNVIRFIKSYCNKDKKRFIILCTHQYKSISDYVDKVIEIKQKSPTESEVV